MKTVLLFPLLALALIGCQHQVTLREVVLPVEQVSFPAFVGPGQELPITLTVATGSCRTFKSVVADRSAAAVRLTILGTDTRSRDTVCTQEVWLEDHLFVDTGAGAARVNPFEIVVNGRSWGTVQVVPGSS